MDLACNRYGISSKSLQRYRHALPDDPELSAIVHTKKLALDAAWAEALPKALAKGLQAIEGCYGAIQADSAAQKDPAVIHALAGALKICAELYFTGKILDARMQGLPSVSGYTN